MKTKWCVVFVHILLCCENSECVTSFDRTDKNSVNDASDPKLRDKQLVRLEGEQDGSGTIKRGILVSPTASSRHQLHYLPTEYETGVSASGYAGSSGSGYGFTTSGGHRGHSYQTPSYGFTSTGHHSDYGGYPIAHEEVHHVGHENSGHNLLSLKGLLIPLAGIALLGAAAALSTNPVLLQLGVLNGRRRRSLRGFPPEVYPSNHLVKPHGRT